MLLFLFVVCHFQTETHGQTSYPRSPSLSDSNSNHSFPCLPSPSRKKQTTVFILNGGCEKSTEENETSEDQNLKNRPTLPIAPSPTSRSDSSMTLSFLEDLRTPGRRKDFRGNFHFIPKKKKKKKIIFRRETSPLAKCEFEEIYFVSWFLLVV